MNYFFEGKRNFEKNDATYLTNIYSLLTNDLFISYLAWPSPDVQQWFILTSRRFENKPLSGTVLEKCAEALKLPANVLIALKQDTGTLTARAVVRHLFPSKARTMDDISDSIREAILGN